MNLLLSLAINRRKLLVGAGACGLAMSIPRAGRALQQPFLSSETGSLRRVLIHPATAADHASCDMVDGVNPFWQQVGEDIAAQHADLALQLESSGAQVIRLEAALESSIRAAKRSNAWESWLRAVFPEISDSDDVRANTLLGRDTRTSVVNMGRRQQPMHGLHYVRDFAAMLPRGLLLCNVADAMRSRQSAVFRFMVAHAPALQSYPVIFDAAVEGLRAEGGDFQVLDERTLLVGVGNHTDARIGAPLARSTGMDVIAVNICNAAPERWRLDQDPLRDFFFHLNTVVAQVAPGHVLVLPWLFETEHTGRGALKAADSLIADFGTIHRYRAWSGDGDLSVRGLKLLDYMRTSAVKVTTSGDSQRYSLDTWLAEAADKGVVFPANERQAANILAVAPRLLLAFGGAERTHAALRDNGVRVNTVAGPQMWRGYGGPHCMALPLDRAS